MEFDKARDADTPPLGTVAILWWGTPEHNLNTAGDYFAVLGLAEELSDRNIPFHIISGSREPTPRWRVFEFESATRHVEDIDPSTYSVMAWCCGPLVPQFPSFCKQIEAFSVAKRCAAGVSIQAGQLRASEALFDYILARDGARSAHFDMALAINRPPAPKELSRSKPRIGICLRGNEPIFNEVGCGDGIVDEFIQQLRSKLEADWFEIDTDLSRNDQSPWEIDNAFASADLVITTRLHGCLLSLRNSTPFIAIDQVFGGFKVRQAMAMVGWPHTYAVERLSYTDLLNSARFLLSKGDRDTLARSTGLAIEGAQATRAAAVEWIAARI